MTRAPLSRRSVVGLGALAVGGFGAGAWLRRGLPVGEDVSDRIDVVALADASGYPSEGPAEAAVTMLVFSDYACGVCREVEPLWRAAVDAADDVRVIHRDWPVLGPESERAARVALAAAWQGRYIAVHDALMRSVGLSDAALRTAVARAGADWPSLQRDLAKHHTEIERLLTGTAQTAMRLAFRGTPGFLIGPLRIEGGVGERQFASAIDRAREAAVSRASE